MECLCLSSSQMGHSCGPIQPVSIRLSYPQAFSFTSPHQIPFNFVLFLGVYPLCIWLTLIEASDTKMPLIALCDVGVYNLWIFDNPSESAGIDLQVVTDNVSFGEIVRVFTEVTGIAAVHKTMPFEAYAPHAEPYPGASVNWVLGPDAVRDDSVMSWRENFGSWWRYWGDGITKPRDTAILDRIHPERIKTLAEWMKRTGYNGKRGNVLKMVEDWAAKNGALPGK